MSIKINYYELLGINEMSSQKEIKNAYRKNAKKYHPDKNPNCQYSEQKFKFINEAYETLSCEIKRKKYDREVRIDKGESSQDEYINLGEEFDIAVNEKQYIEVKLTLEEAYYGVEKEIEYVVLNKCEACEGTGAKHGKTRNCPVCEGKGVSVKKNGIIGQRIECGNCEGKGYFYIEECGNCEGKGYYGAAEKRKIKIPKGISQGDVVKLKVNEETDIYMKFELVGEIGFIRHGADLYYKLDISLAEILLGSKHELKYFNESITVQVPEYSKHKDIVIIEGGGFPQLNSNKNGNLVVELNLIYPEITEDLKKMLSSSQK